MASENIKDHKFLDLLDLSDSEVEEWIPDTDEEWAVTDEEDDPEPNHQERSPHVSSTAPGVYVFPNNVSQVSGQCVNEVLVLPQLAPLHLCLQAGSGEVRCFSVPQVNTSGPNLCQNVSCNSPHGACLADPIQGTTQCIPATQNRARMEEFVNLIMELTNAFVVLASQDTTVQQPMVLSKLGPTPGGTVSCMVNIPCHFPVYTTGDHNGTFPQVIPGPRSPDINVTLDLTVRDNSTGLPGFTFLTHVTTTSAVPGQKQLCVDIGDQQGISDSACFHITFTDTKLITPSSSPASATQGPSLSGDKAKFVSPTPPDGTTFPCSDSVNGCHFLVYSKPGNASTHCPQVSSPATGVYVFPDSVNQGSDQCVSEVLVLPQMAPLHLCLQAGTLPKVTPGPRSPDINVTIDPTVRDNSTGLPGFTFLTPITTTSAVPGQKQLCVDIGDHLGIKDTGCFHIVFTDNGEKFIM
ncbi:hypothetical protein PoB_007575800 [Plakobranchus ocellatus]|uniref:Uncharacterized protein n=1 Tax=Plakobranchus ocellatus TaxID=259542 RepID=A0AAV4DYT8_9GAST|nr:hypothetical protein PoB_007575800 [Plakobranchus ocellatus]